MLEVSIVLAETLILIQQRKERVFLLKSESNLKKAKDEAVLSAAEINSMVRWESFITHVMLICRSR